MIRIASVTLLLALASAAFAQGGPGAGGGHGPGLRGEVYEMIDAYLLMKVQERLDLSDAQLAKVMPLIRKAHTDRRELERRRFHLLRRLGDLLASGTATDDRVAALLHELKAVEAELPATVQRNMDAIDAVLSPVQQAKYRLLEVEIDRRLRELRHRARERRGLGRESGEDGPPFGGPGPRAPRH